ncbi:type IV toxin-antitoxin system AbiEi family antitoxin domain-containing protein [Arthrobacter sp. NPDC093139]|uniref:type IV toxin-antitoxin system AbiEi family antitoxin domain-containing protein n=1 Tax=Arthrobacter sp. NPDC093139 TaxID=3363945 RepID=UPI0038288F5E
MVQKCAPGLPPWATPRMFGPAHGSPHSLASMFRSVVRPGTLDAMQPSDFLTRQGEVARLAQLRRAGFTRSQIGQAVNSGLVLKPRHGVYRSPRTKDDYLRAYEANAAVTCVSAAGHYRSGSCGIRTARTWRPATGACHPTSCPTDSPEMSPRCFLRCFL